MTVINLDIAIISFAKLLINMQCLLLDFLQLQFMSLKEV